jgi:thiamine-monophosphate kinase
VESVQAGIEALASEFDVAIAGGDTNSWNGGFVVNVTLLGTPTGAGPVARSGARPGDWILATGEFGGSLAGKHLSFTPRVREAMLLHQFVDLHAMIDVSDGLAADLHHLLDESKVGAVLRGGAIPISHAAAEGQKPAEALKHALCDGEDFELLFTVTPEDGRRLLGDPPIDVAISHLGEITVERTCDLIDAAGRTTTLEPAGWSHEF